MLAALAHRGPDDEGVHADPGGGMTLGARRLSIIDVPGGHQPVSNEDGSVWAVLNGEIYNHPALQARLRARGHTLRSRTDTEVLVHLYEEVGDALVHALEGMFAFAVWDARRRRLVLGRDRFGEKPLFIRREARDLTFASELAGLLSAAPEHAADLDEVAVDQYFTLGYVPSPRSIVAGVEQLPPGHLLTFDASTGSSAVERYWSPPAVARPMGEPLGDLVAETRRLLEDAVRRTLVSDVPVGVFLSGGLDSTLVTAVAAQQTSEPLRTYTVGYDVGSVSETQAARASAVAIGTDHHELVLSEGEVADLLPSLAAKLDQPLADQALVASHAVSTFARRDVKVAIGGEGADELFGGYPRYRWMAVAERFQRATPTPVARGAVAALHAAPLSPRLRRLDDVLRPDRLLDRHLRWVSGGRYALRDELYGPRLTAGAPATLLEAAPAGRDGVQRRLMLLDQRVWLEGDILAKADRSSMLSSLEVRTPFLDRALAEFAAAVPASVHTGGGGKQLLRRVLRQLHPGALAERRKVAFRVPAADWLRGPLRPLARETIETGCLYDEGWFDRTAARSLLERHEQGTADNSVVLWPLLVAGLWLEDLRRPRG